MWNGQDKENGESWVGKLPHEQGERGSEKVDGRAAMRD